MSNSLITLATYGETLLQNIGRWNVIFGLILLVVALIVVFAIKAIVSKTEMTPEKKDKVVMAVRIIALVAAFGGALAVCF